MRHEHSIRTCTSCQAAAEEAKRRDREERAAASAKALWCDFCDRTADTGWSRARKCAKCGRQFCKVHGQIVWDESDRSAYGWVRCSDHLEFREKLGDAKRGFNLDLLIIFLSLPLAYIGLGWLLPALLMRRPDFYRTRGYGERWTTFRFKGYGWGGDRKGDERASEVDDY